MSIRNWYRSIVQWYAKAASTNPGLPWFGSKHPRYALVVQAEADSHTQQVARLKDHNFQQVARLEDQLRQANETIRLLRQDVTHQSGVIAYGMNERAALLRRNLPVPPKGTEERAIIDTHDLAMCEQRALDAALKCAIDIPFMEPPSASVVNSRHAEFHYAFWRYLEVALGRPISFVMEQAESQPAGVPEGSYEWMMRNNSFGAYLRKKA